MTLFLADMPMILCKLIPGIAKTNQITLTFHILYFSEVLSL